MIIRPLAICNEQPAIDYAFEEAQLVRMIYHPYAIGEENGIPVYICRRPKVNIIIKQFIRGVIEI